MPLDMPLDKPLSLGVAIRNRNTLNFASSKHSPDGYFEPDGDFIRGNWNLSAANLRSFTMADAYIRRRSKDQIDCMQNVEELEEDTTDSLHQWRRPKKTDSRSPCPALNTAANHNYIPRHGRNLTVRCIAKGIRECYNISWGLALMLTVGGFVLLRLNGVGRGWLNPMIDLEELTAHNVLEHNASLTRLDVGESDPTLPARPTSSSPHQSRSRSVSSSSSTAVASVPSKVSFPPDSLSAYLYPSTYFAIYMMIISRLFAFVYRSAVASISIVLDPILQTSPSISTSASASFHSRRPYASPKPNRSLIRALLADSASGTHFTLKDVARARVRRLQTCPNPQLSHILNQFADSELCLSLAMLSPGKEIKVELESLREWLEEERLPRNWKPRKEIGIWENHQNTSHMQQLMRSLKLYRAKGDRIKTVLF